MFKFVSSIITKTNELANVTLVQAYRGIKTKDEYFRGIGYKYDKMYKGGKELHLI